MNDMPPGLASVMRGLQHNFADGGYVNPFASYAGPTIYNPFGNLSYEARPRPTIKIPGAGTPSGYREIYDNLEAIKAQQAARRAALKPAPVPEAPGGEGEAGGGAGQATPSTPSTPSEAISSPTVPVSYEDQGISPERAKEIGLPTEVPAPAPPAPHVPGYYAGLTEEQQAEIHPEVLAEAARKDAEIVAAHNQDVADLIASGAMSQQLDPGVAPTPAPSAPPGPQSTLSGLADVVKSFAGGISNVTPTGLAANLGGIAATQAIKGEEAPPQTLGSLALEELGIKSPSLLEISREGKAALAGDAERIGRDFADAVFSGRITPGQAFFGMNDPTYAGKLAGSIQSYADRMAELNAPEVARQGLRDLQAEQEAAARGFDQATRDAATRAADQETMARDVSESGKATPAPEITSQAPPAEQAVEVAQAAPATEVATEAPATEVATEAPSTEVAAAAPDTAASGDAGAGEGSEGGGGGEFAHGGGIFNFLKGGYVPGKSGGMDDDVPAIIDGKGPARLSSGEFVFDAATVAALGDGNNAAGARKLEGLRKAIRMRAYGHKRQPPKNYSVGDLVRLYDRR